MNWTRLLCCFVLTGLMALAPQGLWGQARAVSGTVLDENNAPLEGATVREKGTANGAFTDDQGRFNLNVASGEATLIVTYFGYRTQEIAVANRTSISIAMEVDVSSLDEVVVVGYGTQVKREITGNIASVRGDELVKVPMASVDQGLQGLASGVQVNAANGVAGGPVRVMVRGTNSISANTQPLWVIDGMIITPGLGTNIRSEGAEQNPLANINPNDIESIEVLKDAAATAIYGSRGSNGVIIVTTKSGKSGKGELTVNYQTGITNLTAHPRDLMIQNGSDWMDLLNEARANSGLDPIDPQQFVREDLYSQDEAGFTLTEAMARGSQANWDEIIRTGGFHDVNLSTSRGFQGGSFYISANYRDEQGVLGSDFHGNGNRFQRLTTRINADLKPLRSLTIGTRTTLAYTNNQRVSSGGGGGPGGNSFIATPGFGIAVNHRPIFPIEEGGRYFDPRSGNNFRATLDPTNLRNQVYTYRALTGVFANWEVPWIEGLSFRTEFSADVTLGQGIFWGDADIRFPTAYAFDDQRTETNVLTNVYGTYNRAFGKHNVTLTAGTERQAYSFRGKNIEGDGLIGLAQEVGGPANVLRLGGFANTGPNYLSYFARANYNFDGRFLLGLSFRRDASTAFLFENRTIQDNTWSNFPGVSAGWILSKESFMEGVSFVNFLKVRASYGRTGNAGIPGGTDLLGFADWGRYGSRGNNVNGGSLLTNIPAAGITWETTDALDAGFDFELFNSRISGTVAYFQQDVTGLILQVPTPPSAGQFTGGSIWANIGELQNRGWEFSLTSYNINTKDFTWQTTFNLTLNRNQVVSLAPELDANLNGIVAGPTTTYAGGTLGEFWLASYAGLNEFGGYPEIYYVDMNATDEDGNPNPNFNVVTDSIIPASRNNIGANRVRTGKSGIPTYFGGLSNTLSYKGIEFTFQFVFQGGNYIYNNLERGASRIGQGGSNYLASMLDDVWSPTNLDARHPLPTWNNRYDIYDADGNVASTNQRFDYNGDQLHDQYLERGDFLRLRTVQLAYNFPQPMMERMNLGGLRVFFTGTNLLTFTSFTGLDPEQAVLQGNQNLVQGVFGTQLPPLRIISGGLQLSF